MDFGTALQALKAGSRLTRVGWNGAGMYVVYQPGYPAGIGINANTAAATGLAEGTVRIFRPYLMFRTVDGSFVPWVASQTDLLAEDWITAAPEFVPLPATIVTAAATIGGAVDQPAADGGAQ